MGITWLASYPKSGNTWVRFLLYTAMHGVAKQSIDISKRIPDIHRPLPAEPPTSGPMLVKTHFALTPGHPRLGETDRAINIIRHPKDVLLSSLNYRRLGGLSEEQMSGRQYAELFIRSGGDPDFRQQGMGTWAEHAASWSSADFPVLTIRYESLKADAAGELRTMLEFLDLPASDAAIEQAVKASSFDNLRAMEIREKADRSKANLKKRLFVGDPAAAKKGVLFMSSGKSGRSIDSIGEGLDEAFNNAFAADLARFGYGS